MANQLQLGQIVATPGALAAFEESGEQPGKFLRRHACGDWGDLSEEDRKENEFSLVHSFRLLSSYTLKQRNEDLGDHRSRPFQHDAVTS